MDVAVVESERRRLWGERLRRLRPEEYLFLGLSIALLVIALKYGAGHETLLKMLGHWWIPVLVVGVCAAIFLRGWWRHRELRGALFTVGRTLREFSPLWACIIVYETLHDLTPIVRPDVVDDTLIAIDHWFLGVDVGRWLNDSIGSALLTEVLVICYMSYGVATPGYAAYLYLKGRNRAFRDLSLGISMTAVLGYTGYLLVPGIGPYLYQTDLYPDRLPQPSWDPGFLDTINNLQGGARDVFPSLHTAMTTVLLVIMWRSSRRIFWGYLPVACGLYLATLYLRVHYAVDVAAGFATAIAVSVLVPRVNDWWYGKGRAAVASADDLGDLDDELRELESDLAVPPVPPAVPPVAPHGAERRGEDEITV